MINGCCLLRLVLMIAGLLVLIQLAILTSLNQWERRLLLLTNQGGCCILQAQWGMNTVLFSVTNEARLPLKWTNEEWGIPWCSGLHIYTLLYYHVNQRRGSVNAPEFPVLTLTFSLLLTSRVSTKSSFVPPAPGRTLTTYLTFQWLFTEREE